MLDQIISAAANFSLFVTGLLVVRAFYPRNGWPEGRAARAFHVGFLLSALAAALNAGAWFLFRAAVLFDAQALAEVLGQFFRYARYR